MLTLISFLLFVDLLRQLWINARGIPKYSDEVRCMFWGRIFGRRSRSLLDARAVIMFPAMICKRLAYIRAETLINLKVHVSIQWKTHGRLYAILAHLINPI